MTTQVTFLLNLILHYYIAYNESMFYFLTKHECLPPSSPDSQTSFSISFQPL